VARTVEECLALASASRAAAATETLENVRRVHLEAAASWESLAQSARYVALPCEDNVSPRSARPHASAHASEIRLRRDLSQQPAVAPPKHAGDAAVGETLIVHRHPDEVSQKAGEPAVPPDGTGIILYDLEGNLRTLDEIEADVIRLAIDVYRGRMAEVARRLGIGRSTLYRKLNDFGIDSANRPDGTMGM
jgi:DNA-binding NtrC family response regulator